MVKQHAFCILPVRFYILKKKLEDVKCISGKGRLILSRINAFQNFYGLAIKRSKGHTVECHEM